MQQFQQQDIWQAKQQLPQLGRKLAEHRQVINRLRFLLPERLKKIKDAQRNYKGSKAIRIALLSKEYHVKLEEYLKLRTEWLELRVRYDAAKMLVDLSYM